MINVKIELLNGEVFYLKNALANNVQHWIRLTLIPQGVTKKWFEVIKGRMIQVPHIVGITEMTEEEVDALNTPVEDLEKPIAAENDTGDADGLIESTKQSLEGDTKPISELEIKDGEGDNNSRQEGE